MTSVIFLLRGPRGISLPGWLHPLYLCKCVWVVSYKSVLLLTFLGHLWDASRSILCLSTQQGVMFLGSLTFCPCRCAIINISHRNTNFNSIKSNSLHASTSRRSSSAGCYFHSTVQSNNSLIHAFLWRKDLGQEVKVKFSCLPLKT